MKTGVIYQRGRIGFVPEWNEYEGTVQDWLREHAEYGCYPIEIKAGSTGMRSLILFHKPRSGERVRIYRIPQGDAGDVFVVVIELPWWMEN